MIEEKKDKYDEGEYDQEGDMAMTQLRSIVYHAQQLHDQLNANDNLPEWVQSKITLAEDYISTASNYLQGEMSEETLDELSKDTMLKYLEEILKQISNRTYQIKNAIEWRRFTAGYG